MDLLTKIQAQFSLARERGIPPYDRTTRGAATFQGSSTPPPAHVRWQTETSTMIKTIIGHRWLCGEGNKHKIMKVILKKNLDKREQTRNQHGLSFKFLPLSPPLPFQTRRKQCRSCNEKNKINWKKFRKKTTPPSIKDRGDFGWIKQCCLHFDVYVCPTFTAEWCMMGEGEASVSGGVSDARRRYKM